ncbi:Hypothetical protein CINCED_3A015181 [Cinara cedri]|nr:Hypothetical protein CINCED_3A015181 [Cinara cedri]
MDKNKTTKSNTPAVTSKTPSKAPNTRSGPSIKINTPSRNFNANRSNNDKSSGKCPNLRSKSNLTRNDNRNTGGLKNITCSNITIERNGSLPNLNLNGNRTQLDKTTQLRFAYDKYLSSLEAKYVLQRTETKINSNISEQKKIFLEEFDMLKKQLQSLSNELELTKTLKIEKNILDKKFEVIELLHKNVAISKSDEELMSLYTNTASKVVVKNFKEMDETDLNTVRSLLNEIIEPLKLLDYENKINARIQLKDLLIKVVMLTNELDNYKLKCEELFDKQTSMQNYNSALKILQAQFGENPDTTLVSNSDIMQDIQQLLDEI